MTDSTTSDAVRAYVLADSDRRDREQERLLSNWEAGWRAAAAEHDDAYERGFTDGLLAVKRAQQLTYGDAAIEEKRWGPGGRLHFADPRPGDYQGGPVTPW